ncbi:unnamed protein product [Somion occarium]|uniref:Aminoglycoside phosphotransferase domain-containing protein n=1 Tax=Somion occarium TaxID=3059160 RepID=A0ABP1DVT8_9APHY
MNPPVSPLKRQKTLWHPKSFKDLDAINNPNDVLYVKDNRRVVRIGPGVLIKSGGSDFGEEVLCSRFAREELSLPVPRILHYPGSARRRFVWNMSTLAMLTNDRLRGVWYISMEEVPGVSLDKVVDTLPEEQLERIGLQLRGYVKRMQSVRGRALGSITGKPYRTFPVSPFYQPRETFENFADFREYLCALLVLCDCMSEEDMDRLFYAFPRNASIRFAHADLLPKNIMVDGSAVTGIIDWASAGFYPDFWDYCRERRQAEIHAVATIVHSLVTYI